MTRYVLSPYARIISDSESRAAMAYHALYGNPRVINSEGLQFLDLFRQPMTVEDISDACDEDPTAIIQEFAGILFLVRPDFDEKKLLRERKVQHLLRVRSGETVDRMGLAISNACNFGCTHCMHFQSCNPTHQESDRQLRMSWETARECVDYYVCLMKRCGRTRCKIHFGNAEPLINWPVIERVLHYCDEVDGLTFEFAINTNLVLMTRGIVEVLKRYQVRIATSLDGTTAANDAIRVTRGGQGTFDRILRKFDLLAKVGYPLDGFSITVTSVNFGLINSGIIDLAAERGMRSIAFDYDLISLIDVPVLERVSKLIELKRYATKRGIDFFGTWDTPFRNMTSGNFLTFCAAVEGRSLEFDVDGSIKVCNHSTTRVGHLDCVDQVFHEASDLCRIVKERLPGDDEYCFGCAIEGLCGGQCHVTREIVASSTTKRGSELFADMCDFYRATTEALAIEYLRSDGISVADNRSSCTL